MSTKSTWEETEGTEYRRNHKRETYDAVTIQFRKDGRDGLTRDGVKSAAEARGLPVGEYIKTLIKRDIEAHRTQQA